MACKNDLVNCLLLTRAEKLIARNRHSLVKECTCVREHVLLVLLCIVDQIDVLDFCVCVGSLGHISASYGKPQQCNFFKRLARALSLTQPKH